MIVFGKIKIVGICWFMKMFLNGNLDIGSYNWRDIIKFIKFLVRVIVDYGEVMGKNIWLIYINEIDCV